MTKPPRYLVYKDDGERLWLIDDFGAKVAASYVHKTVPNFLGHIAEFGIVAGNGYRAIPYQPAK